MIFVVTNCWRTSSNTPTKKELILPIGRMVCMLVAVMFKTFSYPLQTLMKVLLTTMLVMVMLHAEILKAITLVLVIGHSLEMAGFVLVSRSSVIWGM